MKVCVKPLLFSSPSCVNIHCLSSKFDCKKSYIGYLQMIWGLLQLMSTTWTLEKLCLITRFLFAKTHLKQGSNSNFKFSKSRFLLYSKSCMVTIFVAITLLDTNLPSFTTYKVFMFVVQFSVCHLFLKYWSITVLNLFNMWK